ncbi:ASCH/PUA domain-containing protein [Enterococcus faecalis]|nr:DUF3850 domain-containing protein [Listeria monocytogenes]EGO5014324.1 DUF3850 domain-containing protein [Enterococcus faecalis]
MNSREMIEKWKSKEGAPVYKLSELPIELSSYEMYVFGYGVAKKEILEDLNQLDEPIKVVVPEYIDQWLNYCIGAEMTLIEALEPNKNKLGVEVYTFAKKTSDWLLDSMNQQIFVKIWAGDSYEVKGAMIHELKIKPEYFKAVESGMKKFEIRKNDRNYQKGDILRLNEYQDGQYTGDVHVAEITYITDYAQQDGYVVLGIK